MFHLSKKLRDQLKQARKRRARRKARLNSRHQFQFEHLEQRTVLSVALPLSDTFDRVDPSLQDPLDNGLGGSGAYHYIDIHEGATITGNALQNTGNDLGGVQIASSTSSNGIDLGQDLNMKAELYVPVDSEGHATQAGFYFRNRAAAPGDGITGGSSSGYQVLLHSTGNITVHPANVTTPAFSAYTARPEDFDSSVSHTLEISLQGAFLNVALDGELQRFNVTSSLGGGLSPLVPLQPVAGTNNGTGGIVFAANMNRNLASGQQADNFLISSHTSITGLPLEDNFTGTLDYGDAPNPAGPPPPGNPGDYHTLTTLNGPSHVIRAGLHIGNTVDGENDAVPNSTATGDGADEDGIIGPIGVAEGLVPTINVNVTNTTGDDATLHGWIDYNGNGLYDNATERASVAVPSGTNGTVALDFPTVPVGAASSTFARFRLSTDSAAAKPVGAAADVEVEDYAVTISPPVVVTTAVDENNGIGAGAGTSLREAVLFANANPGITITFDSALDGTPIVLDLFGPNEDTGATGDLDLLADMTILGNGADNTIIDGFMADRVIDVASGATVQIHDVTIQNGRTVSSFDAQGAGIRNNGQLLVSGGTITSNSIGAHGNRDGAGLWNSSTGVVHLLSSLVTRNLGGSSGGGISNEGQMTVEDSTVSHHTAFVGGGIHNASTGTLTVLRSVIADNVLASQQGTGGGINSEGALIIAESAIANNTAGRGGGISSGTLTMTNSTVSNNSAREFGGGISASVATITNSTIVGNRADSAGQTPFSGGGINATSLTLENSIVAGNVRGTGTTPNDINGSVSSANNDLIGDSGSSAGILHGSNGNIVGNGGAGTIDINTVLDTTLHNNGGSTDTHLLVTDSLEIDAGSNTLADNAGLGNDQRGAGFPRVYGGTVDIGAFELQRPETDVSLDASNNLVITHSAGDIANDNITIQSDTTNSRFIITDPNAVFTTSIAGSTGDQTDTVNIPFSAVGGSEIIVNTLGGDDSLTVEYSLGNFSKLIYYDGGSQFGAGDSLALAGGTFANATYTYSNENDGSIDVTGNSLISYTELEPITSSITATNVTLNYGATGETITVTNAGGGQTNVDSTAGETTTFNNPSGTLTINTGDAAIPLKLPIWRQATRPASTLTEKAELTR